MPKKLSEIESLRKKLDKVDLTNAYNYTKTDLDINSLKDWCQITSNINNPDKARNLTYYGFQPLYDLLVNNIISDKDRKNAIKSLNEIVKISVDFLGGYYIGEPDTSILRKNSSKLSLLSKEFDNYNFYKKDRNIDNNQIYPQNILDFIRNFLDCSLDEKILPLDYFVGCACGTSEIIFALSSITDTELGFLRYSKRRKDNKVKIIKEQESKIKKNILNKKVGCFEDIVCTGKSLKKVLEEVQKFGANYIKGFSVIDSNKRRNINKELNLSNFKVFSLK